MSVAFPVAIPGTYDYRIPQHLKDSLRPGTPVLVEVRSRKIWGVALAIKDHSEFARLKEVLEIKTGRWSDDSSFLIKLYEWIAAYYQCDLGRVFKPMVSKKILDSNSKKIQMFTVTSLDSRELKEPYRDVLSQLQTHGPISRSDAANLPGVKASAVAYLIRKGFLSMHEQEVIRESDEMAIPVEKHTEHLTSEQQHAVDNIAHMIGTTDKPVLLHGITGSGKTHVYIELTSRALHQGKGVMILVPEISLTPQTITRFRSALGNIMTVIHSNMSDGERRDSLQELVTGSKKVVVGVRSAVLAPMENVGLIIVDEEHDGSYKQSDSEPRYNARDVAVMRGHFQHALVVLGSATPSLESFYNAQNGKYHYLKLTSRYGEGQLPQVNVINMTEEHEANNWTVFSRHLAYRIEQVLAMKRQIILLLNRRGFSTVLICKDCGHTCICPNCSVSLHYHRTDNTIKCHFCGYQQAAPDRCPSCHGEQIKFKGTGIQRAEELLRELFPDANILRMDQDTTRKKGAHISILNEFASGKADILIGTQMVSKGLNFPGVALVGVIAADIGLHLPDFRASERTFQLLTQVAGRAGRADNLGEVVVQTYFPLDTAIKTAQLHDYDSFYTSEIESRRELNYPPFSKLSRILVEGTVESEVKSKISEIALMIKKTNDKGITVLGPTPAAIAKIENFTRYNMLIKSSSPKTQTLMLADVRRKFDRQSKTLRIIIDVDPYNML